MACTIDACHLPTPTRHARASHLLTPKRPTAHNRIPPTLHRYTVAVVEAADQIGFPACISVAVVSSKGLLFQEAVHTGKTAGVWPSPSGKMLPGGSVLFSRQVGMESATCRRYNGAKWEDDPSSGSFGECLRLTPYGGMCWCACTEGSRAGAPLASHVQSPLLPGPGAGGSGTVDPPAEKVQVRGDVAG